MVQLVRVINIDKQETVFELVGKVSFVGGNVNPTHRGQDVVLLPPH